MRWYQRQINSEGHPCYSMMSERTLDHRLLIDPALKLSIPDRKPQQQMGLELFYWPMC